MARPAPKLTENDLRQWKLADDFRAHLAEQGQGCHFVLRLRDEAVVQVEEEVCATMAD